MLDNPNQLDIFNAIAEGNEAMTACVNKAQRIDPGFIEKAEKAILTHLHIVGEAKGEELTDIAKASGAIPHSDKAFGAVFKGLAFRHLIQKTGYAPRARGHGAPGPVWAVVR
mgnify:CR=1 FL=1